VSNSPNLLSAGVDTNNHGVISLERLKGELLLGLDALLPELLDLASEDSLRRGGGVDTAGLDGDHDTTTNLEELVGVETDDTGLIGLGNVGEDAVDHAHEHAVLERVTGVLNDGNNVGAVGGHVDKISAGTVGELDGEDGTSGTDDIGNVRDGSTRGSTEVEDLATGLDVNVVHTTENTGGQLRTERVPDTVFGLGGCGSIAVGLVGASVGGIDANALLAVDGLTGGQVLGDEEILLAASDEHTGVSVGLLLSKVSSLLLNILETRSQRTMMTLAPPFAPAAPPRPPPRPPRSPPRPLGAPRPRPPPRPPRSPKPPD
jgi:hypothetical protein